MSQEENDFFKAFTHALRSSCLQCIDFRDNVVVRGFLSVDVDGSRQRHFVLAERISRGKENSQGSFPLQVLNSKGVRGNDGTASENTIRKSFRSPFSPPKKIRRDKPPNSITNTTKRKDGKPSKAFVFSKNRNDTANLTFTMDPATGIQKDNQTPPPVKKETLRSFSPSTVDLSPGKSRFKNIDTGSGPINRSNCSVRRKRPHETPRQQEQKCVVKSTNNAERSITVSSVSCDDDDDEDHGDLDQKNEDPVITKKRSVSCSPLAKKMTVLPDVERIEKCAFDSFLDDIDSGCSITSVKPNYLVDHIDDDDITLTPVLSGEHGSICVSHTIESKIQYAILSKDDPLSNPKQTKRSKVVSNQTKQKDILETEVAKQLTLKQTTVKKAHKVPVHKVANHSHVQKIKLQSVPEKLNDSRNAIPHDRLEVKNDGRNRQSTKSNRLLKTLDDYNDSPQEQIIQWPQFDDGFEDNYEIHSTKRKRKLLKFMKYFKKSVENSRA